MTKKGNSNIRTTILFVILGLIFSWTYLTVHEQVHVAIFRSYGISSVTHINWFSASTIANQTEYDEKCTAECHSSNNMADVVGYHTALLIFCLTGLFYITRLVGYREDMLIGWAIGRFKNNR